MFGDWFFEDSTGRVIFLDTVAAELPEIAPSRQAFLAEGLLDALVPRHDVVVDCTDRLAVKFALNDAAVRHRVPAVLASVHQYEGQLQVVDPTRNGACLRCIWPQATRDGVVGNCAEAGVLGALAGVMGSLMALEVIRAITPFGEDLVGRLLMVDALSMRFETIHYERQNPPSV